MAKWGFTFTVHGRTPFPMDMLRYDAAWPASEQDSHTMRDLADWQGVHDAKTGGRIPTVNLRSHGNGKKLWEPTVGRWESFGWTVTNLKAYER